MTIQLVAETRMASCHPDRKHYANGQCKSCYQSFLRGVRRTRASRTSAVGKPIFVDLNRVLGLQGVLEDMAEEDVRTLEEEILFILKDYAEDHTAFVERENPR